MLNTLGRSVYLSSFESQQDELQKHCSFGSTIFTSFHISEEYGDGYVPRARKMCEWLRSNGFRILADVSKKTASFFGISDLAAFAGALKMLCASTTASRPPRSKSWQCSFRLCSTPLRWIWRRRRRSPQQAAGCAPCTISIRAPRRGWTKRSSAPLPRVSAVQDWRFWPSFLETPKRGARCMKGFLH